jgi:hypothetical protein
MPHSLHVGAPSCALLGEREPETSAFRATEAMAIIAGVVAGAA